MRVVVCVTLLSLVVLSLTAYVMAESDYIYAIHDNGGEQNMADMGTKGWIVFTEAIGSNPNDYSGKNYTQWSNQGYGVIVRLNNGYGYDGTLPYDSQYANFAQRCANYVAASPGVDYWIIGNETNLPREWPGNINGDPNTGQPITVSRYVSCYNQCWTKIKQVVPSAKIIPSPSGTWAPPYPNQGIEGFLDYWVNILNQIGASKIDGLALHTYTHGCDPALITDQTKMGPPYQNIYYNFQVYRNYMAAIPSTMTTKPVFITETDQNIECADGGSPPRRTWYNVNNGWVKAAYAEINAWNQSNSQKIRCLALFRWIDTPEGEWNFGIQYRGNVIQDWREAMTYGYKWNTGSQSQNDAGSGTDAGNTFSTALSVSQGSYTGWASSSTDTNDYYKFSVTSGQVIYCTMTPPASADFDIYLYNPSGTLKVTAATRTAGKQETINFTADSTGEWRLRVAAYSGSGTYSFSISAKSLGGSNLTSSIPTYLTCGDYGESWRGKYAKDGSLSTKWCCAHNGMYNGGDHWLAYDLGSSASVTGFKVKGPSLSGEPTYYNLKEFYIESATSLQGPWTQEFYVNNTTQQGENILVYGSAKTLRYVRIRVVKPNYDADWAVRLQEFEVWGTAGSASAIKFEAEDYDGGFNAEQGVDFSDSDRINSGGQYRPALPVDIETCSEGGYNVGWIYSGEWLRFPWKATTTTYNLQIRYAGTSAGTCHLEVDGVNKTGSISLPATGGWQTWTTKNVGNISVTTGEHDIKLVMDSGGFNINYFTLQPGGGGPIASEDFESMPSWSSSYDASWGSAATWSIVSGGQTANCLQVSRSSQGSSTKVKVYSVPQNTNITITLYMKGPSYSGTYWAECGYRLGSYTAENFDQQASSWTLIQKFDNDGGTSWPNGNGNVWTQYTATVNTGSNTQISIGYKLGSSGGGGPTIAWDTFRIQ